MAVDFSAGSISLASSTGPDALFVDQMNKEKILTK